MALVSYSDSEDEDHHAELPSSKKRKLSHQENNDNSDMPPLPASFHDLYASTVRVSTTDDPSLHGGRKRIVPHVEGNWSSHVYLEWHPSPAEHSVLTRLLNAISSEPTTDFQNRDADRFVVHSLLQTPLDVPLPLHISLSRSLVLRTETKASFLASLRASLTTLTDRYQGGLSVSPTSVSWHGNEDGSRAFLVLRVSDSSGAQDSSVQGETENRCQSGALSALLKICNRVAGEFDQPLLYSTQRDPDTGRRGSVPKVGEEPDVSSSFHISVAWALPSPSCSIEKLERQDVGKDMPQVGQVMEDIRGLRIRFGEVKIRIGKDVSSLPFGVQQKHLRRH